MSAARERALRELDADAWAQALPAIRWALRDLPAEPADERVAALRDVPVSRLASGPGRASLCALLAGADPVAERLRAAVLEDQRTPAALVAALEAPDEPAGDADAPRSPSLEELQRARAQAQRRQRRLARAREERDRERARAVRAEGTAEAQRRRADALAGEVERLRERLEEQERRLARAADERERAVARERRRAERELAGLRDELRELRREQHERDRAPAPERPAAAPEPAPAAAAAPSPPELRVGRPSQLPDGVARDTTEGARLLLDAIGTVLVDGYNVTRSRRADLDLEGQRDWLVRRLGLLAAQRGTRPVVVFDGERGVARRGRGAARDVEVRFTPRGVTADDELVFAVAALPEDEPVLVVTDDRELRDRLRGLGADLLRADALLGALPA